VWATRYPNSVGLRCRAKVSDVPLPRCPHPTIQWDRRHSQRERSPWLGIQDEFVIIHTRSPLFVSNSASPGLWFNSRLSQFPLACIPVLFRPIVGAPHRLIYLYRLGVARESVGVPYVGVEGSLSWNIPSRAAVSAAAARVGTFSLPRIAETW
jgi:hypothetical protein